MANNRFSRMAGSTYKCESCGRNTRNTGQSFSSKTCSQCWDLAGLENGISDGNETLEENIELIRKLMAEIRAKGGKPELWFPEWANL